MSATAEEQRALIARVARGDATARRALVARLFPVVRARVRLFQSRRADVRHIDPGDVVQRVFVRLLEDEARQLRQWDPSRGATLEGYVGMVTEREAGNLAQRDAVRARFEVISSDSADLVEAPDALEAQTIARETAARLAVWLDEQLPPCGRVILRFLYTDGLDAEEAARALGVNRQVIYNWQHRIRVMAREFLSMGERRTAN